MKFKAIRECPNVLPGRIFDATRDAGMVLVRLGAAEVYEELASQPVSAVQTRDVVAAPAPMGRGRRYRTRRVQAEE